MSRLYPADVATLRRTRTLRERACDCCEISTFAYLFVEPQSRLTDLFIVIGVVDREENFGYPETRLIT